MFRYRLVDDLFIPGGRVWRPEPHRRINNGWHCRVIPITSDYTAVDRGLLRTLDENIGIHQCIGVPWFIRHCRYELGDRFDPPFRLDELPTGFYVRVANGAEVVCFYQIVEMKNNKEE